MVSLAGTEVDTARATIVGLVCRSRGSIGTATGGRRTGVTVIFHCCVMMMKPRSRSWTVLRGFVECGSGTDITVVSNEAIGVVSAVSLFFSESALAKLCIYPCMFSLIGVTGTGFSVGRSTGRTRATTRVRA